MARRIQSKNTARAGPPERAPPAGRPELILPSRTPATTANIRAPRVLASYPLCGVRSGRSSGVGAYTGDAAADADDDDEEETVAEPAAARAGRWWTRRGRRRAARGGVGTPGTAAVAVAATARFMVEWYRYSRPVRRRVRGLRDTGGHGGFYLGSWVSSPRARASSSRGTESAVRPRAPCILWD